MKFQFKEGQWFDARKLTDWQKQWCLENLDWVSEESKSFINCKDLYIMYCDSHPLLKGMAGMSSEWCEPENEITFNDFYWGMFWDEDEEVSQESIFDNPRWVTAKVTLPQQKGFSGIREGKDYRVINTFSQRGDKFYQLTNGYSVPSKCFYKVTPQDLLPEEVEGSFDNLVFTQPLVFGASVPLKNLSDEQLMFIVDYFDLEQPSNHKTHFTCLITTGERYFSSPVDGCRPCYNLSFNDIFKEVN